MKASLAATVAQEMKRAGLPAVQWALFRGGQQVDGATLGAPEDALFVIYSVTKALMAALTWHLEEEGVVRESTRVAEHIEAFDREGLREVTVGHLLTHTSGFPDASLNPRMWDTIAERRAQLASIALQWPPGTRFCYHRSSSMWVLSEVIERATGTDYRRLIHARIIEPLGLGDELFLGLPAHVNERVMEVSHIGQRPSDERLRSVGLRLQDPPGYEDYLTSFNGRFMRERGVPSGGAIGSARAVATLFQAFLGFGRTALWRPETVRNALKLRTASLRDPITGRLAQRALGLVLAAGDDRHYRGFGMTCSDASFGHPGAGGQVAWSDPERDLSFVCLTSGLDRDPIRQGMRMVRLSTLAASRFPLEAS